MTKFSERSKIWKTLLTSLTWLTFVEQQNTHSFQVMHVTCKPFLVHEVSLNKVKKDSIPTNYVLQQQCNSIREQWPKCLWKSPNMWKLDKILLNKLWAKYEIKREIWKHFKLNEKEKIYFNLCNATYGEIYTTHHPYYRRGRISTQWP